MLAHQTHDEGRKMEIYLKKGVPAKLINRFISTRTAQLTFTCALFDVTQMLRIETIGTRTREFLPALAFTIHQIASKK